MAEIQKALPNTRTELKVPGPEQDVEIVEQEEQCLKFFLTHS